jgi:hypothetical protein
MDLALTIVTIIALIIGPLVAYRLGWRHAITCFDPDPASDDT